MSKTGIILAGGKSSRMNQDKGLMMLNEKPMIQYVIEVLKTIVDEIIIISNNPEYKQFGYPVYSDLIKDKGPLAGIYTSLYYSQSETNIILSCDTPHISSELISFLLSSHQNHQITIPEKENQTHQLIGVFSKSCETNFALSIEKSQLKLIDAFKNLNLNIVDANRFDAHVFKNINTPSDLNN
ncbi:MAG: molybdenum cofactor guanylyltransferase [Vicingaceae bacterium]|nr:molybdenum cofactor guanylyltransferase [Vicingaceae bacterium]